MATLAIRSATLWDGTHADPRPGTTVVMRDGDVTWVGPDGAPSAPLADAQVIDADGRWLLPGLIDLHVHLTFDPRDPDFLRVATQLPVAEAALRGAHHARLMLEAGFTGVRDLGAFGDANVAIKRALDNGWVRGPRLATCGVFITVRGGHADLALRREVAIDQGIAVSGVEGVREAVRSRAHRGADWIKVLATAGVMTGGGAPMGACLWEDDELVAAVQASTRLGRKVAAHAHGADGIVAAANAGVATIEHVTMADTRAIDAMAHHGTALIPTFSAAEAVYREAQAGRLSPSSAAFAMTIGPRHRESFKLALDAGVTIGFGTDIGVPGTTFGDNAAEFQTMVAAGMAPAAALRAATSGAATILGWPKAGIVAPGYWGDAVLVDGDPLADVGILANRARVHAVIKGGVLEVDRRPES
ncbi:MAG: amidohydrolase family protein [Chloroflexota bacterium]